MSTRRTYRADIDGLRTIAVLSVALFHGHISPFSGGFVGVDVFFVISGYLITGIIADELAEGRFSVLRFYERRLRRIAPALLVVIAAVAAFTLAFKTPREANMFGESVTFVALMISNFFFFQETGYFGEAASRFALLHTWSLSVEEQFYVIWPPLMIWLVARSTKQQRLIIISLALLSLIGAEIALGVERMAAFYLSPFRFWELMVGACLALGFVPSFGRPHLAEAASALGLALILASVFLYYEGMAFPGLSALAPTLGTALIIHAGGSGRAPITNRLLSLRPVVFVGLCSYSFYLWHWPALSFASYVLIRPLTEIEALGAIGLAFLLSVLSFYLVERPFRSAAGPSVSGTGSTRAISTRTVAATMAIGVGLSIGLGLFLQETKGWRSRFPELAPLFTERVNRYGLRLGECEDARDLAPPVADGSIQQTFCRFGPSDIEPDFIVWGDSHALALWPAFADAGAATGRAGYLSVLAQCPPIWSPGLEVGYDPEECHAQNTAVLAAVKTLRPRQVILIASWLGYQQGEWLRIRATRAVADVQALGAEVAVTAPVRGYFRNVPSTVFRTRRLGVEPPNQVSLEEYLISARSILDTLAEAGAEVIPIYEPLCGSGTCAIEKNGLPLYSDNNHLNEVGAGLLTPLAIEFLRRHAHQQPAGSEGSHVGD